MQAPVAGGPEEYEPNVVGLWDVFFDLIPPALPYVWKGKEIIKRLFDLSKEFEVGRVHKPGRSVPRFVQ